MLIKAYLIKTFKIVMCPNILLVLYMCVCPFYLFINFFIGELLGVDYLLSQTGEPLVVDPDSEETENML